jgi:hypothetical protein
MGEEGVGFIKSDLIFGEILLADTTARIGGAPINRKKILAYSTISVNSHQFSGRVISFLG